MRENRLYGSEGGAAQAVPTPIIRAFPGCNIMARKVGLKSDLHFFCFDRSLITHFIMQILMDRLK